jgi:hypothetical protein
VNLDCWKALVRVQNVCVSNVFFFPRTSILLFRVKDHLIIANNSGSLTGSIPKELDRLTRLRKCLLPMCVCLHVMCTVYAQRCECVIL